MSTTAALPSIFDVNNLAALKGAVKKDDPQALKAAAQQFEALFLQMVMKSMRDAGPREGMFDSEQTRMFESLLDQQLTQVMSTKSGTGLAALIEKQLLRANGTDAVEFPEGLPTQRPAAAFPLDNVRTLPMRDVGGSPRFLPLDNRPLPAPGIPGAMPISPADSEAPTLRDAATPAAREFVGRIWPHAVEASRATGIPAQFMVAQAALETGWGRAELRTADGQPTFNLFGIKAGRKWSGAVAEAQTTEYVDGVAQRQTERFRAYGSYAEAFRDYASTLLSNPRYAGVIGNQDAGGFARALQRAGYATDPAYAEKLSRIIDGPTLRTALSA